MARGAPRDVLWRCTWAGVDDAISFCDWEAPGAEAIAYVFGKTGVPYDALHEVRYFDRRLSVWHDPERPSWSRRSRERNVLTAAPRSAA